MASWIWVLIPLVAIIGAYVIDYQKNKLKWQNQTNSNEAEIDELRNLMSQIKKRVENLEAIVVDETGKESGLTNPIDIELRDSIKKENQRTVAEKAKNKGG